MNKVEPNGIRNTWWRESEFWLLGFVLGVALFARLDVLTMRGEETRRAQVAFEMAYFQDYLTPRQQGELFLSQPPMGAWLISASTVLFGSHGPYAVRFPSAVAVLLTSLLIYGYSRQFMSRAGAVAASLAFATTGEMFLISQKAETEAVYILFLSASLILWHWGYSVGRRVLATWVLSGILVGLASLCKGGLQPILYFGGAVFFYLLIQRRPSDFFNGKMLVGLLSTLAVIGAWMFPYASMHGWQNTKVLWMGDTSTRFVNWRLLEFFRHLCVYPAEIFGSTLPWSLLLPVYVLRSFRLALGAARPAVLFCGLAAGLAFLTCWIPPHGQTRYFAPLYPCLAILIGAVVDVAAQTAPSISLARAWRWFTSSMAMLTAVFGIGIVACALALRRTKFDHWSSPAILATVYFVFFMAMAVFIYRRRSVGSISICRACVLGIAASMIALNIGFLQDLRIRRSYDTPEIVYRVVEQVPPDERIVSFGPTHHKFAYYYGAFIEPLPCPTAPNQMTDVTFFCFQPHIVNPAHLPFRWRIVEVISMARNKTDVAEVVIVGERLHDSPRNQSGVATARPPF